MDEEERTELPDRVGEEALLDEAPEEVDFPEVRSNLLCALPEGAAKRNPNIILKINRLNLRMALPPKGGGVETLKGAFKSRCTSRGPIERGKDLKERQNEHSFNYSFIE